MTTADIEQAVREKLTEVTDPEFGRSISERELIDEVRVEGNVAHIVFHLTVPFCPEVFATHIGREIRKKALEVPGVSKAVVRVKDHLHTDGLNQVFAAED